MNEEIGKRLRAAAEAHQPDHDRMLARVHRGMAATPVRRRPGIARSWPKVVLAGSAAAGILAVAGFAVAGSVPAPPAATTLTVPTTSEAPSSTRSPDSPVPPPATGRPAPATTGRPASSTPPATPAGNRVADGPLSAQGTVDPHSTVYWAQSTLDLDTARPLTALVVEVRITQTGGVQRTGQWQTGPADDFAVTTQDSGDAVVYRWELKPGRTLPAAAQVFAVQYNHAAGTRHADLDSYRVQATTTDGSHTLRGGFTTP
ncbi:hypothetical protein SAMN04489727_7159 [Amycolatopsis tolypomycina]|uniref:Uncharacterized protein n=1 Tax=Amycolatopsis tolypomycina TaxID=208445 RepID=A0A1H4Z9S9_9PSEU|nr:hypothetical protein [Amycolatopsis tolypomycina]SED26677.1 hypothetical protein SAMN04489727_7159 [Amycolatopsis tolypomycina]